VVVEAADGVEEKALPADARTMGSSRDTVRIGWLAGTLLRSGSWRMAIFMPHLFGYTEINMYILA
jgi:hypothetical protein